MVIDRLIETQSDCHNPHALNIQLSTADTNECTKDIDECAQICVDTDGSYYCSCDPGYILADDGQGCKGNLIHYYTYSI